MYHDDMEILFCSTPGHEAKPQHGKTGLCQACYRRGKRQERGLQRPGPKPDPTKPYSRHGGKLTHHGKRPACSSGHDFVDGSHRVSLTGKRICLVCESARTHCHRGHERTAENTYLWKGTKHCKVCARDDQVWYRRLAKYGLSYDDIIELFEEQEYACKLCRCELLVDARYGFTVDHDHSCCPGEYTCGKCIRAILCSDCNKGLGFFKDSPDVMRAAADFIESCRLARAGIL